MKITRKNLDRLKEISQEYRDDCEACNRLQKGLSEKYGQREAEVEREEKKVKIKEKVLWQEMLALSQGIDTGARAILQEKYPNFFEMLENNRVLADQVRQVEASVFDAPFSHMSADRLISIIEGIVDLKFKEMNAREIVDEIMEGKDDPKMPDPKADLSNEVKKGE